MTALGTRLGPARVTWTAMLLAASLLAACSPSKPPPPDDEGIALGGTVHKVTIRVTSWYDWGDDSLRAAIERANQLGAPAFREEGLDVRIARGTVIEIAIPADQELLLARALPDLTAPGAVLDGGGATLRQAEQCQRPDGRSGCDGVVVSGPSITVRNLRVAGFAFDGVAVRGDGARDVTVQDVVAVDNLDDGVGVSAGAGPVLVDRCILMGNGFRTKGKGVLVFDDAKATVRDSIAVANRDGISITKGAEADLQRVWIVGSFDKGLGVSGGSLRGSANALIANGDGMAFSETPPNADGLRVGLEGKASLTETRIETNGDAGVVALDSSSIQLRGGTIRANGGYGIVAEKAASVRADGVRIEANAAGSVDTAGKGRVSVSPAPATPPASAR